MKFFRYLPVCLIAVVIAACGPGGEPPVEPTALAAPVDEKAEHAVEVRHSVLTLMKDNFAPMAGMARGRVPFDIDVVRRNAMRLSQLSLMLGDSFVYDTRGSGIATEALDGIWVEGDAFAEKVANFVSAAESLQAAATNGDEAQTKTAIGGVGKACGSCHDDFREDDD